MNRIVLTEGRDDTELLSQVISLDHNDLNPIRLDIEDCSTERLVKQESSMIRRFLEYRSDSNILLKSEGGKPDLKTAMSTITKQLVDYHDEFKLFMLLDLDGGSISGIIDDIDEMLESRSTTHRASFCSDSRPEEYYPFLTQEAYFSYRDFEYQVTILAFEGTLDDIAGFDKDEPDDNIEDKIHQLAECGDLQSVLSDIILYG